jgi:hypothetical protein
LSSAGENLGGLLQADVPSSRRNPIPERDLLGVILTVGRGTVAITARVASQRTVRRLTAAFVWLLMASGWAWARRRHGSEGHQPPGT